MKIISDMHIHTNYWDGANTVFQMGEEAYKRGLETLGFSEHAYVGGCDPLGLRGEPLDNYLNDVETLQGMYKDRMNILRGLELENICGYTYITDEQKSRLQFKVGSTHNLIKDGVNFPVDCYDAFLQGKVDELFGGDWYALTRYYYEQEAKVVENTDCDIIGHFDVITKFNQDMKHFDENSDEYLEPALKAMDELLHADIPFEMNTGAISRGYRKEPYIGPALLRELYQRGGKICINSDGHDRDYIGYRFDEAAALAARAGFTKYTVFTSEGRKEVPLG